jgi:hypothetical protein
VIKEDSFVVSLKNMLAHPSILPQTGNL